MNRAMTFAIAFVLSSLLTACGKHTNCRDAPPNAYYEELKGYVAALEYSTEHAPSQSRLIAHEMQNSLSNSIDEDINGYEEGIAQMTIVANELEQLYMGNAGVDETNRKVAELVAIVKSLPGEEQAYSSYWGFTASNAN